MQLPLEITFRNMKPSEAVEAKVREKVDKLDELCDGIMGCRVVVEAAHRHHHKGNVYHVRIDVTVPDDELVVSREPERNHAHEDVYVAVRDAFDSMRRQLEGYAARRRRDVKRHEPPPHGRVVQVFPDRDFGRILTSDGREIYFHRNSLVDVELESLQPGTEVWFTEQTGGEGTRATSVHPLNGKHHIVG